jgi:hypothetical protein
MDELTMKRLAVIKQLYLHGIDQSYETEPMNGFSILSFHDSVEMFMKLCAEQKNVRIDRNVNFGDYFVKLPDLQCNATMTNLNSKRVNLKHYGTLPSKLDIEISRANVTDFFEQNTPIFFDIEFNGISLISLIKYESVKNYMETALSNLTSNNYKESITNSQIAFKELMACYEEESTKEYRNPFDFAGHLRRLSLFSDIRKIDQDFSHFVDDIKNAIKNMEEMTKIIGWGIDYKRYCKFRLLSPYIQMWYSENGRDYDCYINDEHDNRKCNLRNARFCFDFVIESALKLQQFDIDINETIE